MQRHPQIEFQRRERAVSHRMLLMACLLICGFTGISVRLWWLQVRMQKALAAEAAALRLDKKELPALRGSIWDRNGSLLAQDLTLHDFYADKNHLADANVVRPKLAQLRGITASQLKKLMTDEQVVTAYRKLVAATLAPRLHMEEDELLSVLMPGGLAAPVLLKDLATEEATEWQKFLQQNLITGVYDRPRAERFRPAEDRLIHVLGLVSKDQIDKGGETQLRRGVEGIEQLHDSTLRGVAGFEYIERDATGKRELPGFAGQVQPPVNGQHVVLTIDMHLQQMLEECLKRAYDKYSPMTKVTSVLVEPSTGSILAMASEPREQVNKQGDTERRNMVVTDVYEPGSTMKIITLSAALDQGVVTMDRKFDCHMGEYQEQGGKVIVRDDESLGTLTVKEILIHSSNIGAYKVAKQLGDERFYDYMKRFGLGSRTGLGLPREAAGILRSPEKWSGLSLSRLAMGYEVAATPLQMVMAISAIANHGALMQPRLVDRIMSADRKTVQTLEPVMVRQAVSARTAALMVDALESVVIEGTGKKAAVEGVRVAGKTGTAQRYDPISKKHQSSRRVVSFAGFAPVEQPKLACLVVLDDPKTEDKTELYGGKLAAPLFAEIVKNALEQMAVAPARRPQLTLAQDREEGAP